MNAGKDFSSKSFLSYPVKELEETQSKVSSEILELLLKSKIARERHVGQTALNEAEKKKKEEPMT